MKVIFSLVEKDVAPWNLDDLIGSVELTLICENGKMIPKWIIPNQTITHKIDNQKDGFLFSGKNAQYRAIFKLEQKSIAPQN